MQKKIQDILNHKRKYLETAIRDAHAAGLVDAPDAAAKARHLFTFYQGLAMEARIQDNLELLQGAMAGTFELLSVKPAAAAQV